MNKLLTSLILSLLVAMAAPLAGAAENQAAATSQGEAASGSGMTDGEVKKIDKTTGKITLKHGDIANLDMPGMTMVFRAKDPAMLDKVKVGDKVRFRAEKAEGAIAVTELELVK